METDTLTPLEPPKPPPNTTCGYCLKREAIVYDTVFKQTCPSCARCFNLLAKVSKRGLDTLKKRKTFVRLQITLKPETNIDEKIKNPKKPKWQRPKRCKYVGCKKSEAGDRRIFTPRRKWAEYCSNSCRRADWFNRHYTRKE
jgi:hypothetical protein